MGKSRNQRNLFAGTLEIMILYSLSFTPMHGYALLGHIERASENLIEIEEGFLYPALKRMLRQGWLESDTGTSAKQMTTKIYRPT